MASLELDTTIDQIRQLPNFHRFLLPPTADELMTAAAPQHPIVVINGCGIRSDAFLIQHNNITTLSLPNLHKMTCWII